MQENFELRVEGVVDHIAVRTEDMERDVREYEHIGIRVETREELEEAARREGRPVREHRDSSVSFYTRGVGGRAVEVIYYPPEYKQP